MKPAPFTYHVAHDVAEAVALLTELGEDAKVLAGGQSLVPMMNLRLARPSALVDITRIPGLGYLRAGPDGLHVGALTRHRAVETTQDPAVLAGFGVLQRSARWIGHYPIRSRGTFGGSIAHGDSTAEWCILAVLLGAQVILAGPGRAAPGRRRRVLRGLLHHRGRPGRGDHRGVVPGPGAARRAHRVRAAAGRLRDRRGRRVRRPRRRRRRRGANGQPDGGVLRQARIVLGGVSPAPFVVDATSLAGQPAAAGTWREAGELAAAQIDPPDDESGDARYRRQLTATLVSRALAEASGQ